MNLNRKHFLIFISILLTLSFVGLRGITWNSSPQFHTIIEVISTMLALNIGVLSLLRYYTRKNNTFLFIGAGFLGTAFLDGYHAIVTSEYFYQIFPSTPSSLIAWSWNASRLYLSVMLFLSWWSWRREQRLGDKGKINESTVYVTLNLLLIFFLIVFAITPLPRAYSQSSFFGRPGELISGIVFLITFIGYLTKNEWKSNWFEYFLVLALLVSVICQIMFMPMSIKLFDTMFDAAHFLKKISYLFVLSGLLISIYILFMNESDFLKNLKLRQDELSNEIRLKMKKERELQDSNKELESFCYSVSHDLRAPLRHISGFLDLLQKQIEDASNEKAQRYIKIITESSNKMNTLIDDLLQLSRTGRAEVSIHKVDLNPIIQNEIDEIQPDIEGRSVEWKIDTLPPVYCDQQLIQIAINNYINNAVKYTMNNTHTIIEISCSENTDDEFIFFVKDNGVGFDMHYYDKLFGVFQRLHSDQEYEGTGIGLATVQRVIKKHGGRTWAESEINQGATFYFSIPKGPTE